MRIRTMVFTGTAAAAVAYLFDPLEGKTRRDRLRSTIEGLVRGRMAQVDRSAPLPQNVAPGPSVPAEMTRDRGAPIPDVTLEPSRAEPVAVAAPNAGVDDAAIVRQVRTKLEERRDLRTDDLVVDVVNGVAYLSGDLHDRQTFGEVVDLTGDVPGVRRVQSLLHLPHSETIARTLSGRSMASEGS